MNMGGNIKYPTGKKGENHFEPLPARPGSAGSRWFGVKLIGLLLACFFLFCPAGQVAAESGKYLVVDADAPIGPGVAEMIGDALELAGRDNYQCVIIRLDTPGGLDSSMRDIIQAIYACPRPVVVYVAPSGARAASAGVMITLAADIAAMAPGTNIGAAHPVGAGGKDIGKTMAEKVVNDMVAYGRSIAKKRGRNADWVADAVRRSVSITAGQALKKGVIDLVADNEEELIEKLEGHKVAGKGVLHLAGARRVVFEEGIRSKILKLISDPNIAYILMMIGLAGLYFELAHPGAIFPGVVGGIAIVLAFFAFQTLPVDYAGLLLIALAVIFFILEIKVTSYGLLSVAGIVSLGLGSVMLFRDAGPFFQPAWQVLVTTVALISAFFIAIVILVARAQMKRPLTGADGLVGEQGIVRESIGPQKPGKVFVHGELWQAESHQRLPAGSKVEIVAVNNLVLKVESTGNVSEPPTHRTEEFRP